MKKSIGISISDEKLAAINMYLEQKNTSLSAEVDKCVENLYQKYVPQNVRDYIEMTTAKKSSKKSVNTASAKSEKHSEQ